MHKISNCGLYYFNGLEKALKAHRFYIYVIICIRVVFDNEINVEITILKFNLFEVRIGLKNRFRFQPLVRIMNFYKIMTKKNLFQLLTDSWILIL